MPRHDCSSGVEAPGSQQAKLTRRHFGGRYGKSATAGGMTDESLLVSPDQIDKALATHRNPVPEETPIPSPDNMSHALGRVAVW